MKKTLRYLLLFLLALGLTRPARATAPPATGRPLGEMLNPDGTLRPGANGSFDARQFRMETLPDGRPVFRPASTKGTGDERWADGLGLPHGTSGRVRAVVRAGTDLYVGGDFTAVGNLVANHIARWNGTAWSPVGAGAANGLNGAVLALAVAGNGDVYAGGAFTQAGGALANGVARWNGTAWSPLGTGTANGTNGAVLALAVSGTGDVYAGGQFTQAGGQAAGYIARWNGTAWSPLGTGTTGLNEFVYALAVAANGDVYAGGTFRLAGGLAANRVAKWNGTAWSSLGTGAGNGLDYYVNALAVAANGDVYAGGDFGGVGGVSGGLAAGYIARWNGTAWSSLGPNTTGLGGGSGSVRALAVAANGDVYAGGGFTQAGGAPANYVARWNGTAWSPLGTGAANGVSDNGTGPVLALAVSGTGEVYVGGLFTQAGGASANNIAKWNGTAWSNLGTGIGAGVNGTITALAVAGNGDVYVGGQFTQAGGTPVNNVARWNGTAWSPLGPGISNGAGNYGVVNALAVAGNGDVYAGGFFPQIGGVPVNYVSKWNGTAWSPLGTGITNGGNYAAVYALAVAANGDVYVGGVFAEASGTLANNVARWNGTAWSPLGTGTANGLSGYVNAVAVAGNGDVYVGGLFMRAGGVAANSVAKWNGTAWSPLGTGSSVGVGSAVNALAVAGNGDVYVAGDFTTAGGRTAQRVARWDGTAWNPLGTGTGTANGLSGVGRVVALALAVAANGDVYVGGQFAQAGGAPASRVARWDGTAWNPLGTGADNTVLALAVGPAGKVYAGGDFATTADGSKVMARFAIYDPNAPLASASAKATPAALFPNPAHGTATLRLRAGAPRLPLTLSNALGQVVRRYPAPATAEAALDLRGLPAGTYVVRCGECSQRLVVE